MTRRRPPPSPVDALLAEVAAARSALDARVDELGAAVLPVVGGARAWGRTL